MPDASDRDPDGVRSGAATYEISVTGSKLPPGALEQYAGWRVTGESPDLTLRGPLPDQSALHGLIRRLRVAGLVLVHLRKVPPEGSS